MIDQGYGQMRPLYEAMSVCESTLQWLREQEREQEQLRSHYELQESLAKLSNCMEEFVEVSRRNPLGSASTEKIRGMAFCLETLNSMTQIIVRHTRKMLPDVTDRLREPISLLLNQVDELADRMEAVMEAWQVPLDEQLANQLKSAVEQIDRTKTDIPDWRKSLELIPD